MKKNDRAKQWQANQEKAEQMCEKFYNVLEGIDAFDDYTIIAIRVLLARLDKKEKKDLCENLELELGCKVMYVDSLAQEMRFEAFVQEIENNPYQLKLIA